MKDTSHFLTDVVISLAEAAYLEPAQATDEDALAFPPRRPVRRDVRSDGRGSDPLGPRTARYGA